MQDRLRLREQADRALGSTGGIPILLVYPVLVLLVGCVSDLWENQRALIYGTVAGCLVFGGLRNHLCRRLREDDVSRLRSLRHGFAVCLWLTAACWSTYVTTATYLYHLESTATLAIIATVGLVAASASNLTPNFPIMLVYMLVMLVPPALATAATGNPRDGLEGGMLLIYCGFMAAIGRRHNLRYFRLSQAMLDLDRARLEQETLLERWRSVVENAPDIILLTNRDRQITFINHTEGGYSAAEVVGQPLDKFTAPGDRERATAILQQVFSTGQPGAYTTEALTPDGQILGAYSSRVGPLILQGRVEGAVIITTNVTDRQQMERELRNSRSQMRRLAARQEAALEDERRRISREVHDELGQLLTAIKIDLGWLLQRLEEGPLYDRVCRTTQVVDDTMNNVRTIARRLRPPILDELGPEPALDWLVEDTCTRAGLEYQLKTSLAGRILDPETSLALFRLGQEALTNIVRHAQASRVEVDLTLEGDRLTLRVRDDGIGISHDQLVGSLGLLGLQERVSLLGGQLTITGQPGHGTEVLATLPLGQDCPSGN